MKVLLSARTDDPIRESACLLAEQSESLDLIVLDSATEIRQAALSDSIDEAWAFSCKDMSTLNLAAALVMDKANVDVRAVGEIKGNVAEAAKGISGIKEILPREELSLELARAYGRVEPCELAPESEIDLQCETVSESEVDEPVLPKPGRALRKGAYVLSVMSGSGGVGKSAIVATAAYLAAAKSYSVAVIDCDLQFGDMRQLMGAAPCKSIDEMLLDEPEFKQFAASSNKDLPILISAPSRLERSEELSSHMDEIVELSASLFDVVLINTGSSWSEVNAQLIERSSCNLFVVDQRASSVRSCKHALDLCMRMGLATGQFLYVLNRCERGSLFSAMDISSAMQGGNVIEVKDGGQEVEELLGLGLAGELAASKNDFSNSLNCMLEEVLP